MGRIQGWIPLFACAKWCDWCLGVESEANSRGQLKITETAPVGGGLFVLAQDHQQPLVREASYVFPLIY